MWPKFPSLFDYRIIINFWERYLTFRPNSLINLYPTIYINCLDHPHYWHFSSVSYAHGRPFSHLQQCNHYWKTNWNKCPLLKNSLAQISISCWMCSRDIYMVHMTLFFIRNAFFQLNLSVAYFFHELSFKCWLGVA